MTFRKALWTGEYILSQAHIEDPKTDAWILLEMVCKSTVPIILCIRMMILRKNRNRNMACYLQREQKECHLNILQVIRSLWDCILTLIPMF